MKYAIIAIILIITTTATGESRYVLNAKRLSTREYALSCNNGGDPTGTKIGDTLIISCGR